jgi:uncharacterized protein
LEKAIQFYPDVEQVPERNKLVVDQLTAEQKRKLFPYLITQD